MSLRKTLMGMPAPVIRRGIPAEQARYAVVLSQIEDSGGAGRSVKRLFLFKEVGGKKVPTPYFLTCYIMRQKCREDFYMDVKAYLGSVLPASVTLRILANERPVSVPASLVIGGKSRGEIGIPFTFDSSIEKLILEVRTSGSRIFPSRLTAVLRNRLPGETP